MRSKTVSSHFRKCCAFGAPCEALFKIQPALVTHVAAAVLAPKAVPSRDHSSDSASDSPSSVVCASAYSKPLVAVRRHAPYDWNRPPESEDLAKLRSPLTVWSGKVLFIPRDSGAESSRNKITVMRTLGIGAFISLIYLRVAQDDTVRVSLVYGKSLIIPLICPAIRRRKLPLYADVNFWQPT